MKKYLSIGIAIITFIFGCWGEPDIYKSLLLSSANLRPFWAVNIQTNQFYQISASKIAEGTNVSVYLQEGQSFSGMTAEQVGNLIVSQFDNQIYGTLTGIFGNPADVDNNGKVIILMLDIKDFYSGPGSGYVAGYFFSIDQFSQSYLNAIGSPYKSNEADLLYMDVNPTNPLDTTQDSIFYGTIAHEFYHMINFNQKVLSTGNFSAPSEESWMDEGMAEVATDLCAIFGPYRKSRVKTFQNSSGLSLLWTGYDSNINNVLKSYALAYMFFRYLGDNFDDGSGAFFERITETSNIGLSNINYALSSLSGVTLESIFKDWVASSHKINDTSGHHYSSINWNDIGGGSFNMVENSYTSSATLYPFGYRYYALTPNDEITFNGGGLATTTALMSDDGSSGLFTELDASESYTFAGSGDMIVVNTEQVGSYLYRSNIDSAYWSLNGSGMMMAPMMSFLTDPLSAPTFNAILEEGGSQPLCAFPLLPHKRDPEAEKELISKLMKLRK